MMKRSAAGILIESARPFVWALILISGLWATSVSAQQPLPLQLNNVVIGSAAPSEVTYRIDLDTLPPRPRLIVEATPELGFEDIQLEVRLENWFGTFNGGGPLCPGPGSVSVETAPSGPVMLTNPLYAFCDPDPHVFNSGEVDVVVRVVNFGAAGAPAKVDISIYAITQVPTNTLYLQVNTDLSPQTISLQPSKDTVIYQREPTESNGAGILWAGTSVQYVDGNPIGFWSRRSVRPLLAFDLGPLVIPFNAQVTSAELQLRTPLLIGSGGLVSLFKVAPSPNGVRWAEGDALAPALELSGATSSLPAANWNARRPGGEDWATPGGDIEGGVLDTINVTAGSSFQTFSSPALDAAVQSMIDTGNDEDGFIMTDPQGTVNLFEDRGVSFYSREVSISAFSPELTLDYVPSGSWSQGVVDTGVVDFTNEGDNFRWIYDTDADDILVTDIGGVCEVSEEFPGQENDFPYTYGYDGPAYTGVDCCTWQVDSDASGTVGVGQALFFHNLNAGLSANFPADTDGDGIVDLCDNCQAQPNGPALGTCVGSAGAGGPCQSDFGCDAGETCDLSQQDADLDGFGDACAVPEPSFGAGVLVALLSLAGLGRRARA